MTLSEPFSKRSIYRREVESAYLTRQAASFKVYRALLAGDQMRASLTESVKPK